MEIIKNFINRGTPEIPFTISAIPKAMSEHNKSNVKGAERSL
jgi:hypothetical protein